MFVNLLTLTFQRAINRLLYSMYNACTLLYTEQNRCVLSFIKNIYNDGVYMNNSHLTLSYIQKCTHIKCTMLYMFLSRFLFFRKKIQWKYKNKERK